MMKKRSRMEMRLRFISSIAKFGKIYNRFDCKYDKLFVSLQIENLIFDLQGLYINY